MLDKGTVVNTVNRYASAVKKEFDPAAIILYGSYARGMARDDSDIDIAVIFNGFSGDWLKVSSRLWHLTEDINYSIEPILLDSKHDPSGFVQNIFKTGQVIYQKQSMS